MQSERRKMEKLIRFRQHLTKFNDMLEQEMKSLEMHYRNVHEYWSDEHYQQYGKTLETASKGIKSYIKESESHERFLEKLIRRLKDYLETTR